MNISIIETNFLVFEPISTLDTDFIFNLRKNKKNNYLNSISDDPADQKKFVDLYLKEYDAGNQIYYKIFEKRDLKKVGLFRFTNLTNKRRVGWESLIISDSAHPTTGIDAILSIYSIVFDILKKEYLGPWLVTLDNKPMMKIHEYMKIVTILETDKNHYKLEVAKENFLMKKSLFYNSGFGVLVKR